MSIPNCSNGAEATATRGCVLPRASLVLTITTAQKIFAISSSRDKISCHNFARLSAWWVRLWRKRRIQTALRQRQHAVAYCREPRLFSQSLPRRKSLLSVRAGTKSPATISQDCLLGVGVLCTQVEYSKSSFCHCEEQRMLRRGILAERNAPNGWIPRRCSE